MPENTNNKVKLVKESRTINAKDFEYKMQKLVLVLETSDSQEALEDLCGDTTTKFGDLFATIGIPLGIHTSAILTAEFLRRLI